MLSDIFPHDQSQYSFVGFLELASVQNVHGGWRLLEDAAPTTTATITVHLFLCAASCLSVSQLSAKPLHA